MPSLTVRDGTAGAEAPVPYWDVRRFVEARRPDLLAAVERVFASGRLILADEVRRFEEEFPRVCGARWGIGVNSGTDAIFLALKALGVGAGDEVLTVANTAVPTVAAIRATGAAPVFVDVEEDTFLMDPRAVGDALTPRTRCVVPVHLAGQAADVPAVRAALQGRDTLILEDCAQACGATLQGRKVGGFGDAGAFSFYPTKVLGAFGDAGMVVTSDQALASRLRRLRRYGMEEEYIALEEGYNSRLDEVQAALLRLRLPDLDRDAASRRAVARRYDEGLADLGDLSLPRVAAGREHQFYLYTVRTARRDELRAHLLARAIETRVNYPVPIHLMPAYASLGWRAGALPVTERLAATILSLPIYPEMPPDQVSRVIEAIRLFFARA